jgi:hypothetical protein
MGGEIGPSPRLGQGHAFQKKIVWQAQDGDGDLLVFRLYYKVVGGGEWVPLLGEGTTVKREHVWETENVPDGRYVLRVAASDEMANPASETLIGEEMSDGILIDNGKPEVTVESVAGRRAESVGRRASHSERTRRTRASS